MGAAVSSAALSQAHRKTARDPSHDSRRHSVDISLTLKPCSSVKGSCHLASCPQPHPCSSPLPYSSAASGKFLRHYFQILQRNEQSRGDPGRADGTDLGVEASWSLDPLLSAGWPADESQSLRKHKIHKGTGIVWRR